MLLVLLVVVFEFARHFAISRRQDVCVSAAQLDVDLTDTRRQPIIGHLLSAQLQIKLIWIWRFLSSRRQFQIDQHITNTSQSGMEWIMLDLDSKAAHLQVLYFEI